MMFTDAEFMTARQKQLVLRDWERFLRNGLKQKHFTKRLYDHLHLHCGFIAHYSRQGYYAECFESGPDTQRFFEWFLEGSARNYGAMVEYDDLNAAMREAYQKHRTQISQKAEDDIARRLELLEAAVQQAKSDKDFAREFLGKINF